MARRAERTVLEVMMGGQRVGTLQAYDVHGSGRSKKLWAGLINGEDTELPNLKAVAAWAKKNGYTFDAPFEP